MDDLRAGGLPPNVVLSEFYFRPGAMLALPAAQQSYTSSNYTHVARDMQARGVNAVLVMVAERAGRYFRRPPPRPHDRPEQQRDQHRDDGDHHQQLDQRETANLTFSLHPIPRFRTPVTQQRYGSSQSLSFLAGRSIDISLANSTTA